MLLHHPPLAGSEGVESFKPRSLFFFILHCMPTQLENLSRGALGMLFLIFICWLFSNNKRAINWKLVGIGIVAQVCFGLGILKINFIKIIFGWLAEKFVELINVGHKGTEFLFGKLADQSGTWGYVFAIQALSNIIFFSALASILYYPGILQKIVYVFAWMLKKLGISGPESVSTAANIFLGQTEAPLMIRPFLEKMTRSEMLCIMVGGMANTAGSVLGAYVAFLGGDDIDQQKYFALHMLSQSIMSAPAAIVVSKILFPQTEPVMKELKVPREKNRREFFRRDFSWYNRRIKAGSECRRDAYSVYRTYVFRKLYSGFNSVIG